MTLLEKTNQVQDLLRTRLLDRQKIVINCIVFFQKMLGLRMPTVNAAPLEAPSHDLHTAMNTVIFQNLTHKISSQGYCNIVSLALNVSAKG